jgi:hypothetical protein
MFMKKLVFAFALMSVMCLASCGSGSVKSVDFSDDTITADTLVDTLDVDTFVIDTIAE